MFFLVNYDFIQKELKFKSWDFKNPMGTGLSTSSLRTWKMTWKMDHWTADG